MSHGRLLEIDGVGNLLLGIPLLFFPDALSAFLGLPETGSTLYPVVLGAVFVGIGAALLLERFRPTLGGLGIGGAMTINLVFGVVLAAWLVRVGAVLPTRGIVVLSALALILIAISVAEALSLSSSRADAIRGSSRTGPAPSRPGMPRRHR